MKARGPIRDMLEMLKAWAEVFETTVEVAADAFDKLNAKKVDRRSSADAPTALATMTTKGKH